MWGRERNKEDIPAEAREAAEPADAVEVVPGLFSSVYPPGEFASYRAGPTVEERLRQIFEDPNPDVPLIRRTIESIAPHFRDLGGVVQTYGRRFDAFDPDTGFNTHFHLSQIRSLYDGRVIASADLHVLGYRLANEHITLERLKVMPSIKNPGVLDVPSTGKINIPLRPGEKITVDAQIVRVGEVCVAPPFDDKQQGDPFYRLYGATEVIYQAGKLYACLHALSDKKPKIRLSRKPSHITTQVSETHEKSGFDLYTSADGTTLGGMFSAASRLFLGLTFQNEPKQIVIENSGRFEIAVAIDASRDKKNLW